MKFWELFTWARKQQFTTSGDAVDWAIVRYKGKDNKNILFLLFQESCQKRDWLNNFDFPIMLYKNQEDFYLVSHGWGQAYKSANDEICKAWIKAREEYPEDKIVASGYSYGSAPALLGAEDIWYRSYKTQVWDAIITFGSVKPLFGFLSRKHFKNISKRFYQFVHCNDICTYCIPLLGYLRVKNTKLGRSEFRPWRLFNPTVWHQSYNQEHLYNTEELRKDIEDIVYGN